MKKSASRLTVDDVLIQLEEIQAARMANKPAGMTPFQHRLEYGASEPLCRPVREIRPGGSEWSDLSTLVERLVPYLDQHNIPGKDAIYAYGNIAKSRQAAHYLRPFLKQPTAATKPVVKAVMRDLADRNMSRDAFAQRYTRNPRTM